MKNKFYVSKFCTLLVFLIENRNSEKTLGKKMSKTFL